MPTRFGARKQWDFDEHQDQLWDWVNNSNQGVMGFDGTVPEECFTFCLEQYARFGIHVPKEIYGAILEAASRVFYLVDIFDPYILFYGISDVNLTSDWSEYTYEVIDTNNIYEANPEYFETYQCDLEQCDRIFNDILSKPALEALPFGLGANIEDMLEGEMSGESCFDVIDQEIREHMKGLCLDPDGTVNWTKMHAYLRLAAWASFAWLAGPLSRDYRIINHEIFSTALRHGEAIMVDGCVISPRNYRKLSRPPLSCYKCGIASWCTEMTMVDGSTRYICEHCLSEGMPPSKLSTCGSKRCLLSQCPHHPYHHMGAAGLRYTMREHGQLRAAADGLTTPRIMSPQEQMMIKG